MDNTKSIEDKTMSFFAEEILSLTCAYLLLFKRQDNFDLKLHKSVIRANHQIKYFLAKIDESDDYNLYPKGLKSVQAQHYIFSLCTSLLLTKNVNSFLLVEAFLYRSKDKNNNHDYISTSLLYALNSLLESKRLDKDEITRWIFTLNHYPSNHFCNYCKVFLDARLSGSSLKRNFKNQFEPYLKEYWKRECKFIEPIERKIIYSNLSKNFLVQSFEAHNAILNPRCLPSAYQADSPKSDVHHIPCLFLNDNSFHEAIPFSNVIYDHDFQSICQNEFYYFSTFTCDDGIYVDPHLKTSLLSSFKSTIARSSKKYIDKLSIILMYPSTNWYHFLFETALPLYLYMLANNKDIKYIFIEDALSLVPQIMEALSIIIKITQSHACIKILNDGSPTIVCERLIWLESWMTSNTEKTTLFFANNLLINQISCPFESDLINQFSDRLTFHVNTYHDSRSKIFNYDLSHGIYLQRKRESGAYRHCINLKDVEDLIINHYSLQPVLLETLSFDEQIYLFSNVHLIVGQTGAAWSNLIFCNPSFQAHAICWGVSYHSQKYWLPLANARNVNLFCLLTEDRSNFTVNLEQLQNYMQQYLTKSIV